MFRTSIYPNLCINLCFLCTVLLRNVFNCTAPALECVVRAYSEVFDRFDAHSCGYLCGAEVNAYLALLGRKQLSPTEFSLLLHDPAGEVLSLFLFLFFVFLFLFLFFVFVFVDG
jgi:hypothetical protein